MSRREILVEHYFNKRFLKSRRFRSSDGHITFGSSPSVDIRLMGHEVNGIHAMVEFEDNTWRLLDLASPTGVRVEGEPVIELSIDGDTIAKIGHHEIKLRPIEIESHLFQPDIQDAAGDLNKGEAYHQVVVRRQGSILQTTILPKEASFEWGTSEGEMVFRAPTSSQWVVHELAGISIQQRLVAPKEVSLLQSRAELTKSEKASAGAVGVIGLLLLVLMLWGPNEPETTEVGDQSNIYTRMILDPEMLQKKREESRQVRRSLQQKTSAQSAQATASAPSQSPQASAPNAKTQDAPKVATNIRTAQLGQILGRINQRADTSRGLASAVGAQQPTQRLRGSGLPSVENAAGKIGSGDAASSSYQLAAVGTSGRGGGVSNFQGVGSLSSGNVGQADVGILEDEGEVDGGLDREVIAQYIRSQLGQIRYCYERQLSANPDLYGKVQVKFTISANGSVSTQSVGDTTLKSAMVEGCILRRVAQWKFPSPKGGTQVRVTYPFLFKSTN